MTGWQRTVLHVDLDAFFASVEQRDDPSLRGKPVLVGGSAERGVVAAASYEARRYGVHSAMPMAVALRRCPQAVVVRHSMGRYAEASRAFFAILDHFSPLVEPLSLDEAFLDLTGSERLLGDARTVAQTIKDRVRAELSLVVSVGVASTKFLAKIASDIDKPDGLCVVEPDRVESFLHPLPVSRLWGVGAVTQDKLHQMGLRTIGDVARYPSSVLSARLGKSMGAHLSALASGYDPRPVERPGKPVSIGHEETFEVDLGRKSDIAAVLLGQADRVAARLRRADLRARVVQLKIKYADFRLLTRRRSLADATVDGGVIGAVAVAMLGELEVAENRGKAYAVRLCGVSLSGLEDREGPRQLTLGEPRQQQGEQLGDALDRIHARFGEGVVKRAVLVPRGPGDGRGGDKRGDD
ncbi:DNA polymerase IV [Haliangium ochraceum]|uniref:DNA polymerase IV n=1 Tax=Haliangium ochraceum (strain DSM 14365 / JCM 11303 / SMP-2) TaxID=502025 RepID=D0LIK9_HALO1|nr:DNA polymerase IV [Haliangium ochraceum]ACY18365.1 DNA-directed DNA polymerase [Haliangium ochraceum DSM 14365]